MIAADTHDLKLRQLTILFILSKLFFPGADAIHIWDVQIPGREGRTEMVFERGLICVVLLLRRPVRIATRFAAARFVFARADKLAVTAIVHPRTLAIVPDVTARRARNLFLPFIIVGAPAAGIAGWPYLFYVIGGIGRHRPIVTIGGDFRIHVKIVEQNKFTRKGVMIGRYIFAKNAKRRIPVA